METSGGNGWWVATRTARDARLLLDERSKPRRQLSWRWWVVGLVVAVIAVAMTL